MSAPKSPVSILQEVVMSQHMPFPLYEIVPEEYGYRGTVVIGQLSANGFGVSKKQAKQSCADRILKMLWAPRMNNYNQPLALAGSLQNNSNELVTKNENLIKQSNKNNHLDDEEPYFNAVTKLNESCCKYGRIIPTFVAIEVDYTGYTVECRYQFETTRGRSYSKKQAKQNAAYQMLKRLEDFNFSNLRQDDKAPSIKQNTFSYNNLFCEEKCFQTKPLLLSIFNNLKPEDQQTALNVNALIREQNPSNTTTVQELIKKYEKMN